MKHSPRLLAVCTLLVITSITSAQIDIDSAEVQAAMRVKHDGSSSLPDGIAFRETLRLLDDHYEDSPATAVQVVIDIMGLSASDANDFVSHAVDTFNAIKNEDRQATIDLACEGKAYDQNPHRVLEQMDDTYEDIAEQHFQATKKRLGDENGARLQLWINSQKHNITHVKFDHEKLDRISGRNAGDLLTKLCSGGQ